MDIDQLSNEISGMLPGGASKEDSEMTEASFQYYCTLVVKLGLPSLRCVHMVLVTKLGLLEGADGFGASVFRCLLNDVFSVCLVRECRELEEHFGTSMTNAMLCLSETSIRAVKIKLKKIDKEITLKRCLEKAPLVSYIEKNVGWTNGMQHLTWN